MFFCCFLVVLISNQIDNKSLTDKSHETKWCVSEMCGTWLCSWCFLEVIHLLCMTHDSLCGNSVELRYAEWRASGFNPGSGGVGRQTPLSSDVSSASWLRWKFLSLENKKEEQWMNKRPILAWKTLARHKPDSGGKSAMLWVKCWGFLHRSGWKSVENEFENLQSWEWFRNYTKCLKKFFFSVKPGSVKEIS